jgi:hypothetical protein
MPMKSIASLLASCSILLSNLTFACTGIPIPQTHTHEQLVKRTDNIVLARASQPQPVNGDLHVVKFYVTDVLKGSPENSFDLTGLVADQNNGNTDYNKHNDLKFWAYSNTGNFKRLNNCNIYGYFKAGEQYLIFIDPPFHPRSFELVSSTEDAWYQEVKKIIDSNNPESIETSPSQNNIPSVSISPPPTTDPNIE